MIFSFFLSACNKSINLYFETIITLNIITNKYIIPKYNIVLSIALIEIEKLYLVICTAKSLAVNIERTCANNIPSKSPAAKDIIPIYKVSKSNIRDIFLFPIPKIMYTPNSFFLLLIKNFVAYIIKPPNITETPMDI